MKKSLIALAALAAFGTASAQSTVTLSGKFGGAFQKGLGSVSQVAVSDGNVTIAAVEDLGGGMKAGVSIDMRTRGREQNVSTAVKQEIGRDATVYISGGFGTVTAGSIEAGNGITGNGWAGTTVALPTDLNNGGVLSANAYANLLQYTAPAISGFTLAVARLDSIGAVAVANTVTTAAPYNTITTNNDRGLSANQFALTYANGPLTAAIDYVQFDNVTTTAALSSRTRVRYSAAYDFGVVKVGAGVEDNSGDVYTTTYTKAANGTYAGKQTTVGISAPIGNLRVGVVYAKNNENGIIAGAQSAGDETAKGFGFGADYSFSKRTVLNLSYANITRTGGAAYTTLGGATTAGSTASGPTNDGSQYRIRLMHSF